jgi:hypothetical protein
MGAFHKEDLPAEIIVGRWLAAAVVNGVDVIMRREMNPRPTIKHYHFPKLNKPTNYPKG